MTTYFSRRKNDRSEIFNVIMRDDEGFETVVDSAKTRERADIKVDQWQAKENRARARDHLKHARAL
jgi:hypothetical protein